MNPSQKRRAFTALAVSLTLTSAALLHAQAVGNLVGTRLVGSDRELAGARTRHSANAGNQANHEASARSAKSILERNPFDSVTGSLQPSATPRPEVEIAGESSVSWEDSPPCKDVRVHAIVASTDPEWSMAMFGAPEGGTLLRRRGGQVGALTLEFVGWDRVWLREGSARCQAPLVRPPTAAPVASSPKSSQSKPSAGPALDPEVRRGIQQVGPSEFQIDRGVLDKVLQNYGTFVGKVQVIPDKSVHGVPGVRLLGVREDSLLGLLGVRDGDRIQSLNGFDLSNPEGALSAFARLRTAEKFNLVFSRNGKNQSVDYQVK